jgi:hypothetical protein
LQDFPWGLPPVAYAWDVTNRFASTMRPSGDWRLGGRGFSFEAKLEASLAFVLPNSHGVCGTLQNSSPFCPLRAMVGVLSGPGLVGFCNNLTRFYCKHLTFYYYKDSGYAVNKLYNRPIQVRFITTTLYY